MKVNQPKNISELLLLSLLLLSSFGKISHTRSHTLVALVAKSKHNVEQEDEETEAARSPTTKVNIEKKLPQYSNIPRENEQQSPKTTTNNRRKKVKSHGAQWSETNN